MKPVEITDSERQFMIDWRNSPPEVQGSIWYLLLLYRARNVATDAHTEAEIARVEGAMQAGRVPSVPYIH